MRHAVELECGGRSACWNKVEQVEQEKKEEGWRGHTQNSSSSAKCEIPSIVSIMLLPISNVRSLTYRPVGSVITPTPRLTPSSSEM